jgi:hypothetical protein
MILLGAKGLLGCDFISVKNVNLSERDLKR